MKSYTCNTYTRGAVSSMYMHMTYTYNTSCTCMYIIYVSTCIHVHVCKCMYVPWCGVDHYYTMLDATMGQDACTPCQAGYDCQKDLTSDHIVVPSPCAAGKYRNQASTLVSCSKCPEGRYGLLRGLRHYTECQSCPEGELFFLFFFF